MKIKILALLLVLVLAIGVFASCGTPTPECNHRDADDNYACDECGAPFNDGVEQKPDKPGGGDDKEEKVYEIPWDETSIKLKATENSNNRELPSCCARYLAGTLTEEEKTNDYSQVDIMIGNRNKAAYETTNLKVTYDYFPEGDSYAWSKCIDAINSEVLGDVPTFTATSFTIWLPPRSTIPSQTTIPKSAALTTSSSPRTALRIRV